MTWGTAEMYIEDANVLLILNKRKKKCFVGRLHDEAKYCGHDSMIYSLPHWPIVWVFGIAYPVDDGDLGCWCL